MYSNPLSFLEYIAVEKVEGVFKQSPVVEQLWVYGNRYSRRYLWTGGAREVCDDDEFEDFQGKRESWS